MSTDCGLSFIVRKNGTIILPRKDHDALEKQGYRFAVVRITKHYVGAYAYRIIDGKRTASSLARVLLCVSDKEKSIDHIDGNPLNNRRENLRVVTHSQNMRNKAKRGSNMSSAFKGVSYNNKSGLWHATIFLNGKNKHLGSFTSEKSAAMAYDHFAKVHFGEYARTNFHGPATMEWRSDLKERHRTSSVRGVNWDSSRKKWKARVCHGGREHIVGRFETEGEAILAVRKFRTKLMERPDPLDIDA